jgi:hypothetical protein
MCGLRAGARSGSRHGVPRTAQPVRSSARSVRKTAQTTAPLVVRSLPRAPRIRTAGCRSLVARTAQVHPPVVGSPQVHPPAVRFAQVHAPVVRFAAVPTPGRRFAEVRALAGLWQCGCPEPGPSALRSSTPGSRRAGPCGGPHSQCPDCGCLLCGPWVSGCRDSGTPDRAFFCSPVFPSAASPTPECRSLPSSALRSSLVQQT